MRKFINPALLLIAAFIWGMAFVAQTKVSAVLSPFTVVAARSFLAAIALCPVVFLLGKKAPQPTVQVKSPKRELFLGGALCGLALASASFFQQWGIDLGSESGKAGFITALYIIIVPFFGIIMGRKIGKRMLLAAGISVVGLYLLCVTGAGGVRPADLLVLVGAFIYAAHILIIDRFAPRVECLKMAILQFFFCGIFSLIAALITREAFTLDLLLQAVWPLLYLGLLSSGVGYTLQIVAQRGTDPTLASIIMSLESVFAVLGGAMFGEKLGLRQIVGCCIMFAAIILAQLPGKAAAKSE